MINSDREFKRIDSYGAGLRRRQADAAKALRITKKTNNSLTNITDLNARDFVKSALTNGLDLVAIAIAAEATKKEK
ncbi:hypothetical protein KKA15_02840 [Patescibacteria group bacterium]|nr:hypothetical protein [Patescibacteria group bacterium]